MAEPSGGKHEGPLPGAGHGTAAEFLGLLEQKHLVPPQTIAALRKQVAEAKGPIAPAAIAKALIGKGLLKADAAAQLLAAAGHGPQPTVKPQSQPKPAPDLGADLGLAPLENPEDLLWGGTPAAPQPATKAAPQPAPKTASHPAQKTAAQQSPKPHAAEKATSSEKPKPKETPAAHAPTPATPASAGSLFDEELPPLDSSLAGPLDNLLSDDAFGGQALSGAALSGDLLGGAALGSDIPAGGALAAAAGATATSPLASAALGTPLPSTTRRKSAWSPSAAKRGPLIAGAAAGLVGLVVLIGIIVWFATRSNGDVLLGMANEQYTAGKDAEAVEIFDRFLAAHPRHSEARLAKVRRGVAHIRLTVAGRPDWRAAAQTAAETLDDIANDPQFTGEGAPKLVAPLVAIVKGLAADARDRRDAQSVEAAAILLKQMRLCLATMDLATERLDKIELSLGATLRDIAQAKDTGAALAAMKQAAAAGQTGEFYQLRRDLLRRYPKLADDDQVASLTQDASSAQQAQVSVAEKHQKAETDDLPAAAATLVLVERHASPPAAAGQVFAAVVRGAVYAAEASSGRVRWRRPVGVPADSVPPAEWIVPVADQPGADLLLVDHRQPQLLRVEAATGKLRWRQPIAAAAAGPPVVAGDRVLLATTSGQLLRVDAASGELLDVVQFPQPLAAAPAVDRQRGLAFLLAEQMDLFVVGLTDGACRQVCSLGYPPGSVRLPPVLLDGYVLTAVGSGLGQTRLHLLAIAADEPKPPQPWLRPAQDVVVDGRTGSPPAVRGDLLALATDRALSVLELRPAEKRAPLRTLASCRLAESSALPAAVWQGDALWVAGNGLQPIALDRVAKKVSFGGPAIGGGSLLIGRPTPGDGTWLCAASVAGQGVQRLCAIAPDKPAAAWETTVATDVACVAVGGDGACRAILADGCVVELPRGDDSASRVVEAAAASGRPPLAGAQPLGDGLLVPGDFGQVCLLDAATGRPLADPLAVPVDAGKQTAWSVASVAGSEADISDGRRVYRLALKPSPRPHLELVAKSEHAAAILGPPARLGPLTWIADAAGKLTALNLAEGTVGASLAISGRPVWGPGTVGPCVMLTTDDGLLWCFDAQGKELWKTPLPFGPLAGAPLAAGEQIVCAAARGVVWSVDAATGKQAAQVELGEPLCTGPVSTGGKLLAGGEGTVYQFQLK